MSPTPEAVAREDIDRQLEAAGWDVQDYKAINLGASLGVAVREYPLAWEEAGEKKRGFADYLLYADGRVLGVVEAKPAGHTLTGVVIQSQKYTEGLSDLVPAWKRPIPFAYESTGKVTQFTNGLDPDPRSREVFTFHRPEELRRLVAMDDQLRTRLGQMPPLPKGRLWDVQQEAVNMLEDSLAAGRPRSLIQMATGSGKTYTACTAAYRLIKHAGAKRILFLVDRNNLGRQTLNEFQQFSDPSSGYSFTEEYVVQHLQKNTIDPASKVVITTIQRLYSMLKGEEDFDEGNEEQSAFEDPPAIMREAAPVEYSERLPIEAFDFIIIDECHRSIYNLWRQVLEYFDAFLIGLTATPTPQTIGFFRNNVVQDYSHEKAVADGVNVGYQVYRIRTQISEGGGELEARSGVFVPHRDKRTREMTLKELEDDRTYTANELDRDVVAIDQIRLVIRTFKEKLFTEIFPGRTEVPKTLIFAKLDSHADDIVKVVKEEFGKGNDFCQKITSKTTGDTPENLLAQFRNSYNPRIAVTVDMIATGTDVKALECLMFMRNVKSASYFEQMKGRGVRVVRSDDLVSVTPDAEHKTHFVIVDAVGVCERDKTISKPLDRKPSVSTEKLLQTVGTGVVHPDIVSTLASRLARLDRRLSDEQRADIASEAGGTSLRTLVADLMVSVDPDEVEADARERFSLGEDEDASEDQLTEVERDRMSEALKPFLDPQLRDVVLNINRNLEQVIDESTIDVLLDFGFDEAAVESARTKLSDFREFIEDHKDEIEALQILYSRPHRAGLRYRHVKQLAQELRKPPLSLHDPSKGLWSLYEALEPEVVEGQGGDALVDLVAIVKHEITPEQPIVPIREQVEARYREWLAEKVAVGHGFSEEQLKWLAAIKDHIAASLAVEMTDLQEVPFAQMGGLGKAHQLFGEKLGEVVEELNGRLVA